MNHQIFERKLRSLDIQGACLSERRLIIYTLFCVVREFMRLVACLSMSLNPVVRLTCTAWKAQLASVLLMQNSGVLLQVFLFGY